jgi:integrase
MARTVKDANLVTRTAQANLPSRKRPYYRLILQGLHLGYYRGTRTGSWSARRFIGEGRYEETKLGTADDVADADGIAILTFGQAQERARAWFAARALADAGHEDPLAPYIVSNALDDYERDYVRRGGKAVDRLRHSINAHIRPALGSIELSKLSRAKIEGWLENLANAPARLRTRRGQAPRHREHDASAEGVRRRRESANRVLTVLKAALNLAYQHDKTASKAAWESVKPYRDVGASKIRYLNDKESKQLVDACDIPFRHLVIAALLTGARYGELAAMRVGDFDPAAGTIHIPRSKSGKPRHIFLTEEGQQFFASIAADGRVFDLLFARQNGEAWGNSHQVRYMRERCDAAGIEPAISFHILRHTYASRLAMRGVPLNVIASQLGHSDTRMTEKHYAHLAPSYVGETIRAAFGLLGLTNVAPP